MDSAALPPVNNDDEQFQPFDANFTDVDEQSILNQNSSIELPFNVTTSNDNSTGWTTNMFNAIALDEDRDRSQIKFIVLTLSFIVLSMAAIYIVVILYDKFIKRNYKQTKTEEGKEMSSVNGKSDPESGSTAINDNE